MRRIGNSEHYFTVRGRGFDTKQWRAVLELAEGIVRRAAQAGIKTKFDGDVRRIRIAAPGDGEPLVIWRKGEPGIPKSVTVTGEFDAVVQSILVATKKVAPDIFVMSAPDGRDYRRLLAKQTSKTVEEIREITKQTREQKDDAFMQAVRRQHWVHPETKNQVEYVSLPKTEQTQIRHRWDREYGRRWDQMSARAIAKVREAEKAKTEARQDKEEAAEAAEDFKQQKQKAQEGAKMQPRKALDMNDEIIRKAAIRVAHSTEDKALKRTLLEILKGTSPAPKKASSHDDKEKEGRHEEGKPIDVGDYLKSKGHDDDSAKWEKHEGDVGKKSSAAVVFPEVHKLAWHHVIDYSRANPKSKTASGSTAERVAAADRLANKWIQDAIKQPGRVHEYLSVPEGETIPAAKLNSAIEKVKGTGNKSLLAALELAKRLKGMKKKKKAGDDDLWLNEASFTKAASEVWGDEHLSKEWVQDAIKRHAALRGHLDVPEDEDISMGKLSAAIGPATKAGDKGLLCTLLLAKRLKGKQAVA